MQRERVFELMRLTQEELSGCQRSGRWETRQSRQSRFVGGVVQSSTRRASRAKSKWQVDNRDSGAHGGGHVWLTRIWA